MSARALTAAALRRLLGPKFFKHYVSPRRVGREARPYNAKQFFESWHRASGETLGDADTIAPGRSALATRYHYNAVETAIIEYLASRPSLPWASVLDIGSGAGHWSGPVPWSPATCPRGPRCAASRLGSRAPERPDRS